MHRIAHIDNPRQKVQKGIFTSFNAPCSFYFCNNRFPCIDDYTKNGARNKSELFKFNVPIQLISDLRRIIGDRGINADTLLLSEANYLFNPKCIA